MTPEEIGSLSLRITVGLLFLAGAWASGKNEAGRMFTTGETSLLLKWKPEFFAPVGIFIMGAGGLSVLLGVFPRLGALGLAIFLVPAAMIHFAKRDQAIALQDTIEEELSGGPQAPVRETVSALGLSAAIGHETSALKNLALTGPALYLVFAGARPPMLIGFDSDWRLDGLLVSL